MEIVSYRKVNMNDLGVNTDCEVFVAHIKVDDVDKRAEEMIKTISDTSWINQLNAVAQAAFEATSADTILKLVRNIHERISGDAITEEFGEYLVSDTAQSVLVDQFKHKKIPLAELLKPRISGNEGFDFHSECIDSLLTFGEAKYSGSSNPYVKALSQIVGFIEKKKDVAELVVLMHHVSKEAVDKCVQGIKSYAAAFSINAVKPNLIIRNALLSEETRDLLKHKKLYIIGVEINDPKLD